MAELELTDDGNARVTIGYPFPQDCARFIRPWCPWCESDRWGMAQDDVRDRYGWPLTVVRCEGCGLIYSRECWTHDGATRFYARHYRPLVNAFHGKPAGYDWKGESAAHEANVQVTVRWFCDEALWDGRLDVGSMSADHAPGRPRVGTGPESDGELWETARVSSRRGLVTCAQTFDHLIDPRLAWDKFADATVKGGMVYVDVVDPHAVLQRGGVPWKSDHSIYVTPRVLRAMADERIWDVQATGYLPDGVHYYGLWRRR